MVFFFRIPILVLIVASLVVHSRSYKFIKDLIPKNVLIPVIFAIKPLLKCPI